MGHTSPRSFIRLVLPRNDTTLVYDISSGHSFVYYEDCPKDGFIGQMDLLIWITKPERARKAAGGVEATLEEPGVWQDFCFAPEGNRLAILTARRLEILRVPEAELNLLLSSSNLQSKFESRAGGLSWAKTRFPRLCVIQ